MRTTNKTYIINECSDKIKAWFLTPLPIIWNRDGEFRVIPIAVVKNLMDIIETHKVPNKITNPQLQIMWSQGIPISNLAGRALVGE